MDANDEDAWAAEWRAYLESSGNTDKADSLLLINWLKARSSPARGGGKGGVTKVALDTLVKHGYRVNPAAAAALERELTASEAGDEYVQCCNARTAYRLLTNMDPTAEQMAWWNQQFASLASVEGSTGIDICSQKSYTELFKPNSSAAQMLRLERALKSERTFDRWLPQSCRGFNSAGLPKVASRLMDLDARVKTNTFGCWEARQAFWEHYFFEEYRGLGLCSMNHPQSSQAATAAFVIAVKSNKVPSAVSSSASATSLGSSMTDLSFVETFSSLGSVARSDTSSSSGLGPSASAVGSSVGGFGDVSQLATALVPLLLPALREAMPGAQAPPAGGGGVTPPPGGGGKRCPFCRRDICPMLTDVTKMCRAAAEALKGQKAAKDAEAKALEDKKE